jgi:hypothetical protein
MSHFEPGLKKNGDRRAACEHRISVAGATMQVPDVGRRCLGGRFRTRLAAQDLKVLLRLIDALNDALCGRLTGLAGPV